jgi:hypothetical protein
VIYDSARNTAKFVNGLKKVGIKSTDEESSLEDLLLYEELLDVFIQLLEAFETDFEEELEGFK